VETFTMASLRPFVLAMLAVGLIAARGNAQCSGVDSAEARRPRSVGTIVDDSARIGSIIGACWGDGSLIRSLASLTPVPSPVPRLLISGLDPSLTSTWNSRLPVSANDGPVWAGRGLNVTASAGVQANFWRFRLIFAPALVTSGNRPFPVIPSPDRLKSAFASPWHAGPMYADLPLRFGNQRYTRLDPGESAAELNFPVVTLGASASTAWWGPGIRNALVMSNNAAGVPRIYLRTGRPLSTRLGAVEAEWILGGLAESPFFDFDDRNNLRSLSAAVVTLRLSADTGLTIGGARGVYASVRRFGRLPGHFADVFTDWHRPPMDGRVNRTSDQITSLFARWVIPKAGVAAHVEWAKVRLPASLRELFVNPQLGQGYTVGLEWANRMGSSTVVRVQAEATTLEQTPETVGGRTLEFYASHSVPQGFTQQGQAVGAATGPGSSSQYIGADVLNGPWRIGGSVGRIRFEDGAYYRPPSQGRFAWRTHDVALFAGLNAGFDSRWLQMSGSVTRTLRMNYLFQTPNAFLPENTTFDVHNTTLSLTVTPHLWQPDVRP
jgi:hypothetical protein